MTHSESLRSPAKDSVMCCIQLPDGREPLDGLVVKKNLTGLDLLERIYELVGVVEKDYFGITYRDYSGCRRWLEHEKTVGHQFKKLSGPIEMKLQVKFYPNDSDHLKNEFSRYLLYQQVRQDIYEQRLFVPEAVVPRLIGILLQAEYSDWRPNLPDNYIDDVKFRKEPITQIIRDQAMAVHKTLSGLTDKEMETQFVQEVIDYPSYGLDMYDCRDQRNDNLLVGIGCVGITTFQFGKLTHKFKWREILKIYHEGKQFYASVRLRELTFNGSDDKESSGSQAEIDKIKKMHKHLCAFRCKSATQAKVMWKSSMERKTFFTAVTAADNNRMKKRSALSLVLRRSTTFNFHGRVQREVIKENIDKNPQFQRFTYASYTLPRMKSHNTPVQMNSLLTPSPSPSARESRNNNLEIPPSSENTMTDDNERESLITPIQTDNLLLNTPPASPDTGPQHDTSSLTDESLTIYGEPDISSVVGGHFEEIKDEHEYDTVTGSSGSEPDMSKIEQLDISKIEPECVIMTASSLHSVIDVAEADDTWVSDDTVEVVEDDTDKILPVVKPCYHKVANPIPAQAMRPKPRFSSVGGWFMKLMAMFVVAMFFFIAVLESLSNSRNLPQFMTHLCQIYQPLRQAFVPRIQQMLGGGSLL